ncbi:TetR family transcriptional regulator [Mycobacterium asiaticum]|uniref:TetR family transcriptional regulator n=1 Tax=Mycobacterium asiaticum TaxID=1790 RepID=A0A1A3P6W7_MYCAS|nr:TetR/AcrR family transcriptional regulator [Mycobacterium asiaticum]OBK29988.1 TetR family transcriptional regulator [Mycobacterium asiaticum]
MTTRSASVSRGEIPTGREQVAAAVLQAAAELFAERGPAATSIRDIATRSKVNHGLVFRHFGAKEKLVGAVLDYLGADLTGLLQSGAAPDVIEGALDRQMRVWARTLLDGYPAEQLQTRFPNIAPLLDEVRDRFRENGQPDSAARLAVANALALQMGWRLFEPMLRSATGLEELDDAERRQAVLAESARMIAPD